MRQTTKQKQAKQPNYAKYILSLQEKILPLYRKSYKVIIMAENTFNYRKRISDILLEEKLELIMIVKNHSQFFA